MNKKDRQKIIEYLFEFSYPGNPYLYARDRSRCDEIATIILNYQQKLDEAMERTKKRKPT